MSREHPVCADGGEGRTRKSVSTDAVRVLIACDHIDFNGALHGGGRQLIELTRALDRTRVAPVVCVLRRPTPLGRDLATEGLPLIFFGDSRFNPATLLRFLALIRRHRIQVLHLTDFGACTFGRIAGVLTGVPALVQIISHHSEHTHRGFPLLVKLAYRLLARFTARALAISHSVRRFSIERMGFADRQVEVLYYPLPKASLDDATDDEVQRIRRQYGIGADEPVVGAVTRFFAVKGIRHLIAAFRDIRRAEPGAWLVLVGSGPEEAALREQCVELGIADRVIFAGFQRHVAPYVRLFDVSVVPSLEEGFGLVAVESMALGTPVVASRIDGLQEVIEDGRSGLLVQPANADEISNAVLRLLRDCELRRRLCDGGRAAVQRFSLDRYVARLTELYQELGAARGRTRSATRADTQSPDK
jgi:glycosyltransferase involved in cell wall biosynthesis